MSAALVLVAPDRERYHAALFHFAALAKECGASPPRVLSPWEAAEWTLPTTSEGLAVEIEAACDELRVDAALLPETGRRKRLLVSDMDSTIIGCECIDELADFAGLKPQIAAITERAMAGELDFEQALTARVAMLQGLPLETLARTYTERVALNPGAGTLVSTMAAHGARCVLVSGGFRYFTSRVAEVAGFHADRGNVLLDDGAALTGQVELPILGREAKLRALVEEAAALGIGPHETLALGDGANDLAMIEAAGLGIAYRAKPVVAARAHARINHTSLETALFYQGYARSEFAQAAPAVM
jgi:phosphoserine phosphatase